MIQLRLSRVAIVVILIITSLPAGFRDPTTMYWRFLTSPRDALANIVLYIPLGLFLQAKMTLLSVTGLAAGMSSLIEVMQLFFVRRNPQPLDIFSNVLGAVCGAVAGRYFRIRSDRVELGRTLSIAAIVAGAAWSAVYFLISRTVPAFFGRGTIAGVSFLLAAGLTGILKPRNRYSRIAVAVAGGIIGGAILLPASTASLPFTFTVAVLFGLAFIMVPHESRS